MVCGIFAVCRDFYYVFIYTIWLKPRTPQNIVIGGAAGAFPPVIGWAGVMGSTSIEPWLMFALIFFWTPPHFWALALVKNDDYQNANIPMLPVIKGANYTKKQILIYGLLLCRSVWHFFIRWFCRQILCAWRADFKFRVFAPHLGFVF